MEKNIPSLNIGEIKGRIGGPVTLLVVVIIVIAALWTMNPFVIVGTGERGVVLHFGAVQPHVLAEGIHFRIPINRSDAAR
jgi:regulator of protease activity HflC (stomatin/prohibitin superfamily)